MLINRFLGAAAALVIASAAVAEQPASGAATASAWPVSESAVAKDPKLESRIKALLASLMLEQKVAQMAAYDPLFSYGFGLTYADRDTLGELPISNAR